MKKTIKQYVSELQQTGLTAKEVFEKIKAEGIKTTLISVKWYFAKNKKDVKL